MLQFFLIVVGSSRWSCSGLRDVGGWDGLTAKLAAGRDGPRLPPGAYTQAWRHLGDPSQNPVGVEWFGLVMGLGFVLSFGYWCTDFLVVQRAMAADSMTAARRTPLIAAVPKMLFPVLVILPGMIAFALTAAGGALIPAKLTAARRSRCSMRHGRPVLDYDLATPSMLLHYFPNGMLGLGLTALLASFMSGMAGNVTAFNTVWTYDIYQSHIRRGASDAHYLWVGRVATVGGVLLSIGAAYVARLVQQHHGCAAAGLRFRQRAALRHLCAGHVLAADHRPWRIRRAGLRHAGGRHSPRSHAAGGRGSRSQGRVLRPAPRLSQRAGADLLDRHRGVYHLRRGHHAGQPGDAPPPRCRAPRAGILLDPAGRQY